MEVIFVLGEYMMQSSEAFWAVINSAMQAWCFGARNHCGFINRGQTTHLERV